MAKAKIVKKIVDKGKDGYPTKQPEYQQAHNEANKKEKAKFPSGYKHLQKVEKSLDKNELMGTNTKSGTIKVEQKFKKYKPEIAYHEEVEHKALNRLKKQKGKK